LIGSIVGTYSSPFVATPIYFLLSSRAATKRKK
ncbi:protein translocase subunit SecF, partial [Candidatus Roizmanbacteria bacterium CG10_big_fil_rev_8_21_14_0_10_45_7]